MVKVELMVSPETAALWRAFLQTKPAGRLREAGLLGDWTLLAFTREVERYLKEGLPAAEASPLEAARRERTAASARSRLDKLQKRVLPMFNENENQTTAEMGRLLGIEPGEAARRAAAWVEAGFLAPGPLRDGEPTWVLAPAWQEINLAASRPSLNAPRSPFVLPSPLPRRED